MSLSNPDPVSILIVDDREEDRLALVSVLSSPDYDLVLAGSGQEALRRVLSQDFALILMDVLMPDLDGFAIASIVKQRDRSRDTPIVFLTSAGADMGFIYRAYAVGAVDYLTKPIDGDVVRAKASVFAELFRKEQRIQRQAAELREADRRERERELAELSRASEKRYRDLAEAIPQIVWTADAHGMVDYTNRRWFDYTGLSLRRTRGRGWFRAIHPEDSARCEERWLASVATGVPYQEECRLRRNDGVYRWHLCHAVPERDRVGAVTAWLGTCADFDDLKVAQEQSETARRHFQLLADASALLSGSLDYRVTVAKVAHLSVPELADWCTIDVVTPGESTAELLGVAHVVPELEARVRELRLRYPHTEQAPWVRNVLASGCSELWPDLTPDVLARIAPTEEERCLLAEVGAASALTVPLVSRNQTLGAMTFVSRGPARRLGEAELATAEDLGHRVAMALDNAFLYQEARQAIAARDEFLSIASHELRTPLTTLQLQLESAQRMLDGVTRAASARLSDKLDTTVRQTHRLGRLIEHLLDVSRIAMGRLDLELEEFDASEAVREVVERLRAEADRAGCALSLHATVAVGRWDRLRIEQVVTNLFSNAIKYAAGKPIDISVGSDGRVARLSVNDQGIGIDKEHVDRIFGRFERAVSSREYGGLGMGLYITRQIVEAHGGAIHVDSAPGLGSTFVVELPIEPETATAAPPS